jgi:hypothetical protein
LLIAGLCRGRRIVSRVIASSETLTHLDAIVLLYFIGNGTRADVGHIAHFDARAFANAKPRDA